MRSRYGFTLVEALIVVVVLGLLVLIGLPRMSAAMVRNDLRGARTTMINLVALARAASVQSNRLTSVNFAGNTAFVLAQPRRSPLCCGGVDTVGTVHNLAAEYGVTVAIANGTTSIQFDPRGFGAGFGATETITLSHGGYSSTITIDGLGRVLK